MFAPMKCPKIEDHCDRLAAGRLTPEELARWLAHCRSCEECAAARVVIERLARARPGFSVPEPHPSYWARFSARLEERLVERAGDSAIARYTGPWWRTKLAAGLAAAALIAIGGVVVYSGRDARDSPIAPPPAARAEHSEDELVSALLDFPAGTVREALDDLAPEDLSAGADSLAALVSTLPGTNGMSDPGSGLYEALEEVDEEERLKLLEEVRRDFS